MKKALSIFLGLVVLLLVGIVVGSRMEVVEHYVARRVAGEATKSLGCEVSIGRVEIAFPLGVSVTNIHIADTIGGELLSVARATLRMSPRALFRGEVDITSAGLYNARANIYDINDSIRNIDFLRALFSKDSTREDRSRDVHLGSLIVRRSSVHLPNGISIDDLSAHAFGNSFTAEGFAINIKRLSATVESDSARAEIKSLQLRLTHDEGATTIGNFSSNIVATLPETNPIAASPIDISIELRGGQDSLNITTLRLDAENLDADIAARGRALSPGEKAVWDLGAWDIQINSLCLDPREQQADVENISLSGNLHASGDLLFAMRNTEESSLYASGEIALRVKTTLEDEALTSQIKGEALVEEKNLILAKLEAFCPTLPLKRYVYHDAQAALDYDREKGIKATATVADALGNVALDVEYENRSKALTFDVDAEKVNPQKLNLTKLYPDATFSFHADGKATLPQPFDIENISGEVAITDFEKTSPTTSYTLKQAYLSVESSAAGNKKLICQSDVANILLEGKFRYATLYDSFTSLITIEMPILPIKSSHAKPNNQFAIYATIKPNDFFQEMLSVPLTLGEDAHIIAKFDDVANTFSINADANSLQFGSRDFYDNYLILSAPEDTIRTKFAANTHDADGGSMHVLLQAKAADNSLSSEITFEQQHKHHIKGTLATLADFSHHSEDGKVMAEIDVLPSEVLMGDTTWLLNPAHLSYYDGHINVDNLLVHHNQQYLNINSQNDDLLVTMEDMNVAYILDFISFSAVSFDGYATGKVLLSDLFSNFTLSADLQVNDFLFEGGALGTLLAKVNFNANEGNINIDAFAKEEEMRGTVIKGYVSPKHNNIDLRIATQGTNIAFIEKYCSDFLAISSATAWGEINVIGPLGEIQLVGSARATGDMKVLATNVDYHMESQEVKFLPNDIVFNNDTILDSREKWGVLTGHLPHRHLSNISYDIAVAAQDLLALDIKEFGEDPYLGTVYATGTCRVREVASGTRIDVNITPENGSFLTYNATAPDRVSDSFIHWNDPSLSPQGLQGETSDDERDRTSDMWINFRIDCHDNSQLRVLMDERMGDLITLNGSGLLTATYYNKGEFNIFGNYLVSRGTYRVTIQDVIQRDFTFQQGGTLSFSGDPLDAQINLEAEYSLASVPLSDINIGKSFSNNSVRVDCLMNITGTPDNPQVDFNLDMPTIGADAKQMIMNMFADTEELNQQVIYLIAIGRFLNQYSNNSSTSSSRYSQTSLAMQSFLSGTISQQINNVLESVIGNKQWNFGANISPGEEGFNDAVYEGLVSGSMFNSRLLFNGQFGYRDNPNATSSFIGDFDLRYLLVPTGSIAVRIYNETNNRYFTKNTLNTQGVGLIIKKDFSSWKDLFRNTRRTKVKEVKEQPKEPNDSTSLPQPLSALPQDTLYSSQYTY